MNVPAKFVLGLVEMDGSGVLDGVDARFLFRSMVTL